MATDSRKDDDKDRHMPVHNGGGDTLRRIEVITGTGRRRRWDAGTKARIVAESFEPGCAVSEVARRHDISPGLLFLWRRQSAAAAMKAGSLRSRRAGIRAYGGGQRRADGPFGECGLGY
jgi:transposase